MMHLTLHIVRKYRSLPQGAFRESWIAKPWCPLLDAFELWCWRRLFRVPWTARRSISPKGSQSQIFIGRTDAEAEAPVLWPPDVKSWLTGKYPDAGKDCMQKEKGATGWDGWIDSMDMWVKVTQSCPTLCDPMDYTVHGILQASILEWVAFPFSRGSSQPRDRTQASYFAGGFSTSWATRKAQAYWSG